MQLATLHHKEGPQALALAKRCITHGFLQAAAVNRWKQAVERIFDLHGRFRQSYFNVYGHGFLNGSYSIMTT